MSLSLPKKILFTCIVLVLAFVLMEAVARVFYTFRVGPSVLTYGLNLPRQEIRPWAWLPDNRTGRYTKFHPHQVRLDRDPDTQEPYRVTINSRGFRGKEFSDEKKPGVIRVITR
jgi:hypothetical protein